MIDFMKKKSFFLLFFLLFSSSLFGVDISSYKVKNYCIEYDSDEYKVIRDFFMDKKKYLLAVNSSTLKTTLIKKDKPLQMVSCKESKYKKLLNKSYSYPYPLINDGIVSFKYGLYLTVDLCPSSKHGYEREFFKSIIKRFANPVPVAIFITKRWIKRHKKEFNELKRWQKEGKLAITWGNHTAYHFYKKGLKIRQNFVLYKHEHFVDDVLEMEKFLLKNQVIPSAFFRFPGLVSNKKVIKDIKKLSLIVVGSDAWIAKGQVPKDGSIILVHGNKNEHQGIKKVLKYFSTIQNQALYPVESAF